VEVAKRKRKGEGDLRILANNLKKGKQKPITTKEKLMVLKRKT
jgi:hypothetical protein